MHATATLDDTGHATLTINNAPAEDLTAKDDPDAARAAVLRRVTAAAAAHGHPITLTATDPRGTVTLLVHPDGRTDLAPTAAAADSSSGRTRAVIRIIGAALTALLLLMGAIAAYQLTRDTDPTTATPQQTPTPTTTPSPSVTPTPTTSPTPTPEPLRAVTVVDQTRTPGVLTLRITGSTTQRATLTWRSPGQPSGTRTITIRRDQEREISIPDLAPGTWRWRITGPGLAPTTGTTRIPRPTPAPAPTATTAPAPAPVNEPAPAPASPAPNPAPKPPAPAPKKPAPQPKPKPLPAPPAPVDADQANPTG